MFIAVTFIGGSLGITGLEKVNANVWPAVSALLIVGLLPNLPWFSQIELWLRGVMHDRAMIVHSVDHVREELVAARPNFDTLSPEARDDLFPVPGLKERFLSAETTQDVSRWIKSDFIIRSLEKILSDPDLSLRVGRSFFDKYESVWNGIIDEHNSIRDQAFDDAVKTYGDFEKACARLKLSINNNYEDVYNFVSCAIVNRTKQTNMPLVLETLRFKLTGGQSADKQNTLQLPLQADALFFSFWYAILAIILIYTGISFLIVNLEPDWRDTWPRYQSLGGNSFSVVLEYLSIGFGICILYLYRKKKIESGDWFRSDASGGVSSRSYLCGAAFVLAFAIAILIANDILGILGADNRCVNGLFREGCIELLQEKLKEFPIRSWLKVASFVISCVLTFVLLEIFTGNKARPPSRAYYAKLAAAFLIVFFFECLGKFNLGLSAANGSSLDTAYLTVGAVVSFAFWAVFLEAMRRSLRARSTA